MRFDSLMGNPAIVWFCAGPTCDDVAPWKSEKAVNCPNCDDSHYVTRAVRFGNMETDENGDSRLI